MFFFVTRNLKGTNKTKLFSLILVLDKFITHNALKILFIYKIS